jgi:hypothetical protein
MAVAFRQAMNLTSQSDSRAPLDEAVALLSRVAALLYLNGQTTRSMIERVDSLAHALGYSAKCFPNWGELRFASRNRANRMRRRSCLSRVPPLAST